MSDRTCRQCIEEGREKPVFSREMCRTHYHRWWRAQPREKLTERPCIDCGEPIPRKATSGTIPKRCESCKPRPRTTCVACGSEIQRTPRPNGALAPAPKYCSDECKPRCTIKGCKRPRRKREWCANHYATWCTYGDPETPPKHRWAEQHLCLVCGRRPSDGGWESPHRRWCSARCQRLWYKHDGEVPTGFRCEECGKWVDLVRPGHKRKRSDSRSCEACSRVTKYSLNAFQVADRDGNTCRLCGDEVDLHLRYPDWLSPSVDHIIPRSKGGSHEPDNLQLAHWICNVRRKDRDM